VSCGLLRRDVKQARHVGAGANTGAVEKEKQAHVDKATRCDASIITAKG
jgi:hypothetical protein